MAQSDHRAQNRGIVLQLIQRHGSLPRARIAAVTGLTPGAVSRIVRELIEAGLLEEGGDLGDTGKPGRRFVDVRLAPEGAYVVGVGFEAFSQWLGLGRLDGSLVAAQPLHLGSLADAGAVWDKVAEGVRELLARHHVAPERVAGVGVAIVGLVDPGAGAVMESVPLGWQRVEVRSALAARLGRLVAVDNLLNATNLAEVDFGVCRGQSNVVLVRTSLSVGASLFCAGRLVRGGSFAAGQIGHIPVPGTQRVCTCGRVGCLETVASGRGILAELGEVPAEKLSTAFLAHDAERLARVLTVAASGGRPAAQVVRQAGVRLGEVLGEVATTLNPESIILSGPVGSHPVYTEGVREGFAVTHFAPPGEATAIHVTAMEAHEAAVRLALSEHIFSDALYLPSRQAFVA